MVLPRNIYNIVLGFEASIPYLLYIYIVLNFKVILHVYIGIGLTCWETANLSPYLITLATLPHCMSHSMRYFIRIKILVELHVFDPALCYI